MELLLLLSKKLQRWGNKVKKSKSKWRREADKFVRDSLAKTPKGNLFFYRKALFELALGEEEGAIGSFKKALSLNRGDYVSLIRLGNLLEKRSKIGEALACYLRALRLDSHATDMTRKTVAEKLMRAGRYDEAIGLFEEAIQRTEQFLERSKQPDYRNRWGPDVVRHSRRLARQNLADTQRKLAQCKRKVEEYREITPEKLIGSRRDTEEQDKYLALVTNIVERHAEQGTGRLPKKMEKGLKAFIEAKEIEQDESLFAAYRCSSDIADEYWADQECAEVMSLHRERTENMFRTAAEKLEEAAGVYNDPDLYVLLTHAYYQSPWSPQNPEKAYQAAKHAYSLQPDSRLVQEAFFEEIRVICTKDNSYSAYGKEALEVLDRLIETDQSNEHWLRQKAWFLSRMGDFDGAEKVCEELLQRNQDDLLSYSSLGSLYHQKGELDNAIRVRGRIIDIMEQKGMDASGEHRCLSGLYREEGNIDKAVEHSLLWYGTRTDREYAWWGDEKELADSLTKNDRLSDAIPVLENEISLIEEELDRFRDLEWGRYGMQSQDIDSKQWKHGLQKELAQARAQLKTCEKAVRAGPI